MVSKNSKHSIIDIENLSKSYLLGKESVPVLHSLNMEVLAGDYVAIMGQSGSGKSTLLNIIGCLDIPSSGSFHLINENVSTLTESQLADRRNSIIGFVFQNFNLLPRLTLEANVELPLIYLGWSKKQRRERVEYVMSRFGIWDRRHHKPNEVSGGQKQRTAIARALVKKPQLLLADEPTGNLDSATAEEILRVFDELHEEGHTIVLITHEKEVAVRAKRRLHLKDGHLVQFETVISGV